MSIVLASGSPRRREILEMLGFKDMLIIPAKGEEDSGGLTEPGQIVRALSSAKAEEVAAGRDKEDVIIGSDTIVWSEGRVLGKPHSRQEAVEMLSSLSGKSHQVYTGVTVIRGDKKLCRHEMSRVCFRELSPEEIEAYVDTGEPMDKAGAYGAQGRGALFVRGIEGDFFNVMGLPVCLLGEMLKEQGVEIL